MSSEGNIKHTIVFEDKYNAYQLLIDEELNEVYFQYQMKKNMVWYLKFLSFINHIFTFKKHKPLKCKNINNIEFFMKKLNSITQKQINK